MRCRGSERQSDTEGMKAEGRRREEAAVQSKCREMRKKNRPNHTSLESANMIANTLHDNQNYLISKTKGSKTEKLSSRN